jgi:hypothetical protein
MAAAGRRMALTPDLVARAARAVPDPGPLPGSAYLADADYDALVRGTFAQAPPEGLWVFAYGSLLWKPAFEFEAGAPASVPARHPEAGGGDGVSGRCGGRQPRALPAASPGETSILRSDFRLWLLVGRRHGPLHD